MPQTKAQLQSAKKRLRRGAENKLIALEKLAGEFEDFILMFENSAVRDAFGTFALETESLQQIEQQIQSLVDQTTNAATRGRWLIEQLENLKLLEARERSLDLHLTNLQKSNIFSQFRIANFDPSTKKKFSNSISTIQFELSQARKLLDRHQVRLKGKTEQDLERELIFLNTYGPQKIEFSRLLEHFATLKNKIENVTASNESAPVRSHLQAANLEVKSELNDLLSETPSRETEDKIISEVVRIQEIKEKERQQEEEEVQRKAEQRQRRADDLQREIRAVPRRIAYLERKLGNLDTAAIQSHKMRIDREVTGLNVRIKSLKADQKRIIEELSVRQSQRFLDESPNLRVWSIPDNKWVLNMTLQDWIVANRVRFPSLNRNFARISEAEHMVEPLQKDLNKLELQIDRIKTDTSELEQLYKLVVGQDGSNHKPPPKKVVTGWKDAEKLARDYLCWLGFIDARLTGEGADGGVDVRSKEVVAQVKMHATGITRGVVQQIAGIAAAEKKVSVIFAMLFSSEAKKWGDDHKIALFRFQRDGSVAAITPAARTLRPKGRSSNKSTPKR